MIVDTHVHVFTAYRKKYPRIRDTSRARSIPSSSDSGQTEWPLTTIENLVAPTNEADVDKATLVQASFGYKYDNSYAIDAALAHPARFTAVVGDRVGDISSTTQAMGRHPEVKVAFEYSWGHEVGAPPAFSVREPLFALAKNPNVYIKTAINNIAAAREGGGKPEALYAKLVDVFDAKRIMWSSNYPAHPEFGRVKPPLNESKKVLSFPSAEDRRGYSERARSRSTRPCNRRLNRRGMIVA